MDIKKFSSDFKSVYRVPNEEVALAEFEVLKEKWGKKYPYTISNWESNWDVVSPYVFSSLTTFPSSLTSTADRKSSTSFILAYISWNTLM